MLKGHVFAKQIFGNPIFALFINTFLNGVNGVSNNYKNGMSVSYSGSNVTINSGAVCIQGRFLEEDTYTTISAGTDSSYCKLVIEINLDLENTESELNQASYKIVKSSSSYPSLTQTNIVKTNSGIYQYELARFRTSSGGITNFQDMRTFLDFDSIYEEIQQHIQDIDNGSLYLEKSNFLTYHGVLTEGVNSYEANITLPSGFTSSNTIVVSAMAKNPSTSAAVAYAMGSVFDSSSYVGGGVPLSVKITTDNSNTTLQIRMRNINIEDGSSASVYASKGAAFLFKITLMKLESDVSEYQAGDVNLDGQITSADSDLIMSYIAGSAFLTDKQFKLADMNGDGVVDEIDALAILQLIS